MKSLNWVNDVKGTSTTLVDKVKQLLSIKNKLVLVQAHEIERLATKRERLHDHSNYIDYLYNHYIVNSLPKTYLYG